MTKGHFFFAISLLFNPLRRSATGQTVGLAIGRQARRKCDRFSAAHKRPLAKRRRLQMTESDFVGGRVQKTLSECIRIQVGCKACRQRSRGAKVIKPHSTFCFGCSEYRHEGGSAAALSIGIVFSRRYVRDPSQSFVSHHGPSQHRTDSFGLSGERVRERMGAFRLFAPALEPPQHGILTCERRDERNHDDDRDSNSGLQCQLSRQTQHD